MCKNSVRPDLLFYFLWGEGGGHRSVVRNGGVVIERSPDISAVRWHWLIVIDRSMIESLKGTHEGKHAEVG